MHVTIITLEVGAQYMSCHFICNHDLFVGEIQGKGMQMPFTRDIYRPMLRRLKQENLVSRETSNEKNGSYPDLAWSQ